ncbi:MAG: hypothetical protein ABIV39_18725 [Verrucomicrobiota bacterium]
MKRIFPKSKLALVNLTLVVSLLGGILWVESGPEPWLNSEKVFMAQLHNSLWNLDRAKYQWATEKTKTEDALPTFEDLTPYLGEWNHTIEKLKALGVEYKITSTELNQSDVATLSKGIRFRAVVSAVSTGLELHFVFIPAGRAHLPAPQTYHFESASSGFMRIFFSKRRFLFYSWQTLSHFL